MRPEGCAAHERRQRQSVSAARPPYTGGPRYVPATSWSSPRPRAGSSRVRNHCSPAVWRYSSGWVSACGSARWSTRRRNRWWASGTPAEQADELNALLRDPEVRAIVAHTGGQATIGYLDLIDLDAIRADPKPILGYSDISLLHMALYAKTGLVGFHADIATHGFGSDWYTLGDEARRSELVDLYTRVLAKAEAPGVLPARGAWETWRPGRAQGPLFGGLPNRLVLLPLRLSGVLDRIAGMVVGIPTEVTPHEGGGAHAGLRDVVLDVLAQRDIPVLAQVDFGHTSPNLPLPIGVRAHVDADNRTLSLLESAVAEG
ncbi:S66 peptidase family protein [Streptomyces sp. GMR22]|uniref:S66 peptidase family protein n=1 Tax=Streptomyces sp. GMR22 TaxID=2759524 RepID=UPI002D7E5999|nr:LD-carboxypeptidase [Streptomyces sp. GMR22]